MIFGVKIVFVSGHINPGEKAVENAHIMHFSPHRVKNLLRFLMLNLCL
jgi:hypothetical protein